MVPIWTSEVLKNWIAHSKKQGKQQLVSKEKKSVKSSLMLKIHEWTLDF